MKHLRIRILLPMALVLLLAGLALRDVPIATGQKDLSDSASTVETDLARGRLAFPEVASSVMVTETMKLSARDGVFQDMLGTAVAIDGDTVVAGAPQAVCSLGDPCLPGNASIFTQAVTGEWSEQRIAAYDGQIDDFFGEAIAIDGDILVVGANEGDGSINQGSAYIYQRSQTTPSNWEIVSKQDPTDPDDYLYGWSVAVSGDTVVVGAPTSYFAGFPSAAYIYERNQGGANHWGRVKRWAPVTTPAVIGFGIAVSIQGDTLVVGARQEAYVYERDLGGPGEWGQRQRITAPEGATRCFGYSTSIQGDTLVIGDECDLGRQGPYGQLAKGAAYIYIRNPVSNMWGPVKKLVASDSAPDSWTGYFGAGASVNGDTIVIGAPYVKVGANDRQGAAYLFCRNQGGANQWGEVAKLVASDGGAYDYFGNSVGTQGGSVVVGSPYANINGNVLQGAAYLYAGCKQPLVFIHGAAGSRMVDHADGNEEIWPGRFFPDLIKLSLFTSDNPSFYIQPYEPILDKPIFGGPIYRTILEALIKEGGYREYLVEGNLSFQTSAGCDYTYQSVLNPDLFVFTYDWRESIDDISVKLKDYMGCVQQFFPNSKVNILAHSMGGVIARRYILDNPSTHNVNALITVGSPFLGAPKMPFVLETGEFFDQPVVDHLRAEMIKYLSGSFTSAHQLAPGKAWYELGGASPFGEAGFDLDGNGKTDDGSLDYPQFVKVLDKRYGFDKNYYQQFYPGSASQAFHTVPQDNWSEDPPQNDVLYHHLFGIQLHDRTIGRLIFQGAIPDCYFEKPLQYKCKNQFLTEPKFTSGDGTVPVLSAERIGNGKSYNAPSARLYPITNPDDELASHVGMLSNLEVIKLILDILKDPTYSPAPLSETQTAPAAPSAGEPAQYLTIRGGDSLIVRDAFGHDSGTVPGNDLWRKPVPGVDLYVLGEHTNMAVLPAGETFTITFTTVGEPLAIEMRTGTGSTTTQVTRYRDLELLNGVVSQLQVTSQGAADLSLDLDGDEAFETSIPPTVVASGDAALDMDPPLVSINSLRVQGNLQVTITAMDPGAGVKAIFYSLDGVTFIPYTGPLDIQECQSSVVYAFADDMLSNRSSLEEKTLPCDTLIYLPTVIR